MAWPYPAVRRGTRCWYAAGSRPRRRRCLVIESASRAGAGPGERRQVIALFTLLLPPLLFAAGRTVARRVPAAGRTLVVRAARNHPTSPCGSARRCPASTSSLPPASRVPTAGVASCWSSAPLKTPASQAVLSLPAFAVDALRDYQQLQRQRTRAPPAAAAGPARPGPPAGRARPGVAQRAWHGGSSRPCQPGVPRLRARRRDRGASPSAAPLVGLGVGGGQGTRQRDRRAVAPRRRRHAGQ
jgi:hypothetical protein